MQKVAAFTLRQTAVRRGRMRWPCCARSVSRTRRIGSIAIRTIAVALAPEPRLLIADEPTTALDVTVQMQILRLLSDLRAELGLAVIMITHDLGVVAQTCDRIAVMSGGRLCEVGGTREVLGGPLHPYTRGLIDCQPASEGGQGRLTIIDGQPPSADPFPSGCRFHPRCRRADEAWQSQPLLRYGQDCHSHAVACHHILPARQEG